MPAPERDDQRPDVLAREHLVEPRLLDVEQLAAQRQDRLEATVAALLRRAAGRVALDDVELGLRRIALLAVRELARKREAVERALADDEVARLAGRLSGPGGSEALLDDPPAIARVLLEVLRDPIRDRRFDLALHVGVAELRLGLALELGFDELDADHGGQALANVLAREVGVVVLEDSGPSGVLVQDAGQRGAEARQVRAAVDRVDVVGEGERGSRCTCRCTGMPPRSRSGSPSDRRRSGAGAGLPCSGSGAGRTRPVHPRSRTTAPGPRARRRTGSRRPCSDRPISRRRWAIMSNE